MNDKQHITQAEYEIFTKGQMSQDDTVKFLTHISSCNFCAGRLDSFMAGEMLTAPKNLKEHILTAVNKPEVQLAVKAKTASKRMQLFLYSLKVGTATAGALLLLLLTINHSIYFPSVNQNTHHWNDRDHFSLTDTLQDSMNKLSENMLDFSNSIMNMEVFHNDKKEK